MTRIPSFWRWFLLGHDGTYAWERSEKSRLSSSLAWLSTFLDASSRKQGYYRLFNGYLLIHAIVGLVAWAIVRQHTTLHAAAGAILLPLLAAFVGVSFAWSGSSHALLQSPEIKRVANNAEDSLADYPYNYQAMTLAVFVAALLWAAAGLGAFSSPPLSKALYCFVGCAICSITSLALRECWQMVHGTQLFLVCQMYIADAGDADNTTASAQAINSPGSGNFRLQDTDSVTKQKTG